MNSCDTVVYDYLERADSLVKTKQSNMIIRQTDGFVLLLKYLEDERKKIIDGILPVNEKWKDGVIAWYKRMEAHAVISLLTNVGIYLFAVRKDYVNKLNGLKVFPLSMTTDSKKTLRKIRLANIHPLILVWFIHLKNYFN